MRLRTLILLFLTLAICAPAALAQQETGRISGTITDAQDRVVPGVNVTATATSRGTVRSTVTDSNGRYVLANLQPAAYDVKFQLTGFKASTTRLTVAVGQAINADAKLEVGGMTENVSVTAASEAINTANAEVSTVVREDQIREMPNLERDPYSLVQLSGNAQAAPIEELVRNNAYRGTGYNINGGRSSGTHILLDGASNNFEFDTSVGQHVPLDSVQEFSVVSNNFSAQYGRATGGVVNVITKSGSNLVTGTAYEFYRTEKMAANTPDNIANDIPKGVFTRNQPGFSVGGPIVKDKIHFFSSLEVLNVKSADTMHSWIPTPQLLAASSPATRAYFQAYDKGAVINGPLLSRADVSGILGADTGAFSQLAASLPVFGRVDKSLPIDAGGGTPQKDYQFVGKVDFNIGNATQAYVRLAFENFTSDPGTNSASPYPGFDTGQHNRNYNLLGSMTHVYSSSMTSQTKVAISQVDNEQPTNGGPPSPRLVMNPNGTISLQGYNILFPGYLPDNPAVDIPAGGPQKTFQLYHDVTWLKGNHDIRFGGSYVHIADDHTFSAYSNAVEALNTTSNGLTSLDNLVTGNILRFQAAINPNGFPGGTFTTPVAQPSFLSHNRYNEFSFYAQDNWSVTNRFRANLGLRYDYFGPQLKSDPRYDSNFYYGDPNLDITTATPAQIIDAVRTGATKPSNQGPSGTLWKPDWNNFGPRLGFAWDVNGDGKTSVRGGYGISYERNFGNVTFNVLFNPPQYLVSTIDTGTATGQLPSQPIYVDDAGPFAGSGVTKTIPVGSLRHVDQNIETAYMHQYGFSVQRQLGTGVVASVEYNGTTGRKLYDLADINKRGAPLLFEGAASCISIPTIARPCDANDRPNPLYTAFNTRGNRGQSQYNGVTFSLEDRSFGRTGLTLSGKYTLSQSKDNLSSTFDDGNNGYFGLGYLDPFDPMADYGYSEFDVRHRFLLSATWNVPYLNDATGMKRTLLGGWTLSWIFTARTGYPFTLFDCTNALDNCSRAIDNANLSRSATGSTATGNPNEYTLLDLTPILGAAGSYVNPITGVSDYGPFPANMTKRDDFRGPGAWFLDLGLSKRFRFGTRQAVQFRFEAFNILNHANMLVHTENADVSSFSTITGYKDGNRRSQIGVKFEF